MSKTAIAKILLDLQKLGKIDAPRKRTRKNLSFDCPFHSKGKRQETPSFGVHIETGEWNCFNPSCGRKGPSIQALFATLTGTAQAEVEAIFPVDMGATDDLRDRLSGKDKENLIPRAMAPYPGVKLISDYPEAVAYMTKRKIPEWVWSKLGLRYCPSPRMSMGYKGNITVGGKRIVFPIYFNQGNIGFLGRSILPDPLPKWRPIENTATFFYDPLNLLGSIQREVVLVEGEFDLAACVREGLPTMGCFGARIGEMRAHLLQQFDKIFIMFDGNQAGQAGIHRAMADHGRLLNGKLFPFKIPEGYDPAELPLGFGASVRAKFNEKKSFSDTLKGKLHG
jgi:hypothetical protein